MQPTRISPSLLALFCISTPSFAFEPTSAYEKREVRGFTVYVHPEVRKHKPEDADAMKELDSQFRKLLAVVPEKHHANLRKTTIWVEWEVKPRGAAECHVSAGWLKENGYNPDKLLAVEINNAKNFVKWSRQDQPWMVMHELAHAYHHRVLGTEYPQLVAAYKQAMERKLYDSVDRVGAKKQKAYAATNPAEYFAELSEAYFGKNDFFPFTRTELEKHDPIGYKLMREVWGEPVTPKN